MASRSGAKGSLDKQSKTVAVGSETLEGHSRKPSSLQVSKGSKSGSTTLISQEISQKQQFTVETTVKKKSYYPEKKGSPESLAAQLDTSLRLGNIKQTVIGEPKKGLLEKTIDQDQEKEKKTSEQGNVKDSSVSAKVSDGASSLAKTSGSAKISDRLEFVESGKSSMCRGSTSSNVSDESTCSSLSSSINKPHKANDSRWEAIQAVRAKEGVLDLRHFRLLKKLGCGDIGSVYLSELCGTKSYFAMKVMDKASLASRKKLLRAQTEREILQCLDHPFLPTLYTHFETEKFSCLVMEFCPGGDLHTLRQRQPGKHFPEQAVKYVSYLFIIMLRSLLYRLSLIHI